MLAFVAISASEPRMAGLAEAMALRRSAFPA